MFRKVCAHHLKTDRNFINFIIPFTHGNQYFFKKNYFD